jgi:hypothetical protein
MKANKISRENERYAPTQSLLDEDGKPLQWEFQHISSKEFDAIRDSCTIDVQVTGKPNAFRPKFKSSQFIAKLIVASTVVPDLYEAELQDSYGVKTPEELLYALVDNPGEYSDLGSWVQKFQGFDASMEDKIAEAKN